MTNFGSNLMLIRRKRRMTQAALDKAIGTSGDTVGRYERGDITPSIEVVVKMADVLEVSVDYLVSRIGVDLSEQEVIERIEAISKLSTGDQAFLFRLIDMVLKDMAAQKVYAE